MPNACNTRFSFALLFLLSLGLVNCTIYDIEGEFELVVEDHGDYCNEYGIVIDLNSNNSTRLNASTVDELSLHAGDIVHLEVEDNDEEDPNNEVNVIEAEVISRAKNNPVRTGGQRLLVVLVNYNNANAIFDGCGEQCIRNFVWRDRFNVDTLYRQASYGVVSLPETRGMITSVQLNIPTTQHSANGNNQLGRVRADAAAALLQRGINVHNFDFVAHYSPALAGIGVAFVGGRDSFMNSNQPDTLGHELGHNFGMLHAGLDLQNSLQPSEEYGDRSSTMGYSHESLRSFSVPHQLHMRWIPSNRIVTILDRCDRQRITLHASNTIPSNANHRLAVSIPRDALHSYVLSLRTPVGHDTLLRPLYTNVVSVHYVNANGLTGLVGLVRPGTTFTDRVNGYTFAVGVLSGSTIDVTMCPNRPVVVNSAGATPVDPVTPDPSSDGGSPNLIPIIVGVVAGVAIVTFVVVVFVVGRRRRSRRAVLRTLHTNVVSPETPYVRPNASNYIRAKAANFV